MSSEQIVCTEPSLTTSVKCVYALVKVHRTFSELPQLHLCRESSLWRVLYVSSEWFDCNEPSLTTGEGSFDGFSCTDGRNALNLLGTSQSTSLQRQQSVERVLYMSLEWFDCTEPSLTTTVDGKQVYRVLMHQLGAVEGYGTSSNHVTAKIGR